MQEAIGLILAELIQEVHTAGVDDAVAHRRLRLRPGGCDVLGGSCRLGCHRVAVNYTDTPPQTNFDPVDLVE